MQKDEISVAEERGDVPKVKHKNIYVKLINSYFTCNIYRLDLKKNILNPV